MGILKDEWLAFYLLFGHTYSMGSNELFLLSWNYSERTFCCCRNSCHCTHLPRLSLQSQIPVFTRNLPLTTGFQIHSISGNQAPKSRGWALCVKAILEPSFWLWAALTGSCSHRKWAFEAERGLFPRSTLNARNYCFIAKLVPSPTKIHGMQKDLQESLCCS